MFEDQIALERAQGHRGFATRFFAPISSTAEANQVIREMSIALFGLAAFQACMSFYRGWALLVLASLIAIPVFPLMLLRSRVAAIALLVAYALLAAVLIAVSRAWLGALLFWCLLFGCAWRAARAAFARDRKASPGESAAT